MEKKKEEKEEEEKKKEKIPHMCESIGHRPLRGRCPKSKKIKVFNEILLTFFCFFLPQS